MTKRLKILIITAVALALVFLIVWYYPKAPAVEDIGKSLVSGNGSALQEEQLSQAKDILGVLSMLKTINLNLGLFNSAEFKNLEDFSVQLPVIEAGKDNPFAP